MIDDTLAPSALPRYVHPETGAPWFACPRCSSVHVRPRRLQTAGFGVNGTLMVACDETDYQVPGSDRGVRLDWGRTYGLEDLVAWLECGACALAFRPDGDELAIDAVPRDWHSVIDDTLPATVGVVLREHVSDARMADLEPLRRIPLGPVGFVILELREFDGGWLDEARSDDTTGVHIHPQNFGIGVPPWLDAPFTEDAVWPDESIFDDSNGQCIAYRFEPVEGFDSVEPS